MKKVVRTFLSGAASALTLAVLIPNAHAVETAFEKDTSLPLVYLNVAVKAGSVTDPENQSGLTNFMGEMLLRGTKARNKEQLDLALDQIGAQLSVETRAEALVIRGAVLASQLDPFLKILSEIVTQPSFPEAEIRKLKSEVVSSIREELGTDATLESRRFTRFLFRGHPYGKPVLGKIKDVEALDRAKMAAHYDRLLQDKLLLVVGAGDADSSKIEDWAKQLAKARPSKSGGGDSFVKVSKPENPPKRRLQIVDKPDRTQTQMDAGQIGLRMTDDKFFPLFVGNHAFGGGSFSARLMTEIRVKRGWSYGAGSVFRHGLQPRSWHAHLFPAAKDAPAALAQTLKMIEEVQQGGITQVECDFARNSLVNSSGFMYNTPKKRVENRLLERTLDLPDGFMQSYGPRIEKVKLAEVNDALREFIKPGQLSISVLGTASELKDALAKAAGVPVSEVEVVPYTQE